MLIKQALSKQPKNDKERIELEKLKDIVGVVRKFSPTPINTTEEVITYVSKVFSRLEARYKKCQLLVASGLANYEAGKISLNACIVQTTSALSVFFNEKVSEANVLKYVDRFHKYGVESGYISNNVKTPHKPATGSINKIVKGEVTHVTYPPTQISITLKTSEGDYDLVFENNGENTAKLLPGAILKIQLGDKPVIVGVVLPGRKPKEITPSEFGIKPVKFC